MGRRVLRKRVLGRAASVQLVARLVQPIYQDGECGCSTSTSLGIRIARGNVTLDLVYNAGHLFLPPEWHHGRFVGLADADWLAELHAGM